MKSEGKLASGGVIYLEGGGVWGCGTPGPGPGGGRSAEEDRGVLGVPLCKILHPTT